MMAPDGASRGGVDARSRRGLIGDAAVRRIVKLHVRTIEPPARYAPRSRRDEDTTCTAVAPDPVPTLVRAYGGIRPLYGPTYRNYDFSRATPVCMI